MEEANSFITSNHHQNNSNFTTAANKVDEVSFARSQDVDLYQVTLAKDSAWPFLVEMGSEARCIQFVDLNRNEQSFNLPYTPQIKACDETLQKLKYLIDECSKAHITLNKPRDLNQFN